MFLFEEPAEMSPNPAGGFGIGSVAPPPPEIPPKTPVESSGLQRKISG